MRRQLIEDAGVDVPATHLAVIDVLAQASAMAREEFAALVTDPTRDAARFASLCNVVVGASRTLGLKRIPKDVPTVREFLEQQDTDAQS